MSQQAKTKILSEEQKVAHVRKTRQGNYQASMRLEGFQVSENSTILNKAKLIRKYKKMALKCA